MCGMKKDVMLHLIDLMGRKHDCIRIIFGVCVEFYEWKRHPGFLSSRIAYNPPDFLRNRHCKFTWKHGATLCDFINSDYYPRTAFLNRSISKGVWQWTVQIACKLTCGFDFGVAPSQSVHECRGNIFDGSGGCGLMIQGMADGAHSLLRGVEEEWGVTEAKIELSERPVVSMEADVGRCTLCFFVDGRKDARAITRIPSPLHFGVAGYYQTAFVSVSFRQLQAHTASRTVCTFYEYTHHLQVLKQKEKRTCGSCCVS